MPPQHIHGSRAGALAGCGAEPRGAKFISDFTSKTRHLARTETYVQLHSTHKHLARTEAYSCTVHTSTRTTPPSADAFRAAVVSNYRERQRADASAEDNLALLLESMKVAEKTHLVAPDSRRPGWYRRDKTALDRLCPPGTPPAPPCTPTPSTPGQRTRTATAGNG